MDNFWTNKSENKNKIDFILDNFNFATVEKTMTALEWNWHGKGVPTAENMREMAQTLLEELARISETNEVASGGFRADRSEGDLRLSFCVEDMESTYYKDQE